MKISLQTKMISAGLFIIFSFVISILLYFIPNFKETAINEKKEKIQDLTNLVYSTTKYYHNSYINGDISEAEAKKMALNHIKTFKFGKENENYFWINNLDYKILLHPHYETLSKKNMQNYTDANGKKIFQEFVKICKKHQSGFVQYHCPLRKNKKIIATKISFVKLFKEWKWVIGTEVYLNEIDKKTSIYLKNTLIVSSIIVFLSILLVIFISRNIAQPILKLTEGLKSSDLTTQLEVKTNDEIGQMTIYFNTFVQKIREMIIEFKDSSNQLASSSEQMSASALSFSSSSQIQTDSSKEIVATVDEITNEMNGVTRDIDFQFDSMNGLVQMLEDLSSLINNLNVDTIDTLQNIESISEKAKTGEDSLNEMNFSIKKIGDSSVEMNNIIKIINEISEKINLLSLNASIEAARAGDAGRGFAVVADEISKLADQTANSIKDISRIITENDSEITVGLSKVETTVDAIGIIITGIKTTKDKIQNISSKMQDQVGKKEQINTLVQKVQDMSEGIRITTKVQKQAISEITNLINNINSGSIAISNGAEELSSNSEEIASMAEFLNGKAQEFKV